MRRGPVAVVVRCCTLAVAAVAAGVFAGCTTPSRPPPSNVVLPFDDAADAVADALAAQARSLADGRSGVPRAVTVADPVLDTATGRQTAATVRVDRRAGERLAGRLPGIDLVPLSAATLPRARYVLTGTVTRALPDRPKGTMLVNLALTDPKSGKVVAQAWALARGDSVDATPLPCDADSPVRVHDRTVEALVTTAATGAGQPASAVYLQRLAASALAAEAARLCNDGQPAEALDRYRRAAAAPGGDSIRVLNGLYVTSTRLGRANDAEHAFDRLVAAGLASRQFDVQFLFRPGATVLTADGRYPLWLRRIARAAAAAKVCLQIVGHASATGASAAAEALSLQRASYIRQRLVAEAAVLGGRTAAAGVGARENLVGSGTDDAVDALDRRIDFRVVSCG